MPESDAILQVLGRAHPLVLHLPIGLLAGLVSLELWSALTRRSGEADGARGARAVMLWLTVFASLAAAASGLLLAREGMHGASGVAVHRNLGLVFTASVCVAALCHAAGLRGWYLRLLSIGLIAMVPAGHFGAALTHGERFLYAPLVAEEPSPETPLLPGGLGVFDPRPAYATHIAPVLGARCVSCHGPDAQKGGLRLDSPGSIARGGSSGAALVPGDPEGSLLLARMLLPLEHEDHMPPISKTQPGSGEIDLIEAWIRAGAPARVAFNAGGVEPVWTEPAGDDPGATPALDRPLPRAPAAAREDIDRLVSAFVHVSPVAPGSPNLWIDLAPIAASVDDERFRELVGPVLPSLGELYAARASIGDRTVAALTRARALTTLDLSWTGISPDGLASIGELPELRVLRLVGTGVDDESIEDIARIPALRAVYLWRTAVTAEGIASLREQRPDLDVHAGAQGSDAIETEGELAISSHRPIPGEEHEAAALPSLKPFNDRCPVSGAPVDPSFAIVFEGRVLGFCCANCLTAFVRDPSAYAGAIDGG